MSKIIISLIIFYSYCLFGQKESTFYSPFEKDLCRESTQKYKITAKAYGKNFLYFNYRASFEDVDSIVFSKYHLFLTKTSNIVTLFTISECHQDLYNSKFYLATTRNDWYLRPFEIVLQLKDNTLIIRQGQEEIKLFYEDN